MLRNRQTLPFRFAGTLVAVAAAAGLAVSSPVAAQGRCFKVVDLGDIGAEPFSDLGVQGTTEPFAINNSQQVVFNVEDQITSEKRAYLFLQTAAFGLASGCHNLHTLAGFAAGEDSAVHDINDAGLAVGWATFNNEQHAVVWLIKDHALGVIPFEDLGLLSLLDGDYSAAFAINDETPFPIIVGEGDVKDHCFCGDPPLNALVPRGYWLEFTDPAPDLVPDAIRLVHNNGPHCKPITSTHDVNTVAAGHLAPTIAAGLSTDTAGPCVGDNFVEATVWKNGVAVGVDLPSAGASRWAARGVSDSGAVVGSGDSSALYWDDTTVAPLDIGSLVASVSFAQRINNNDPPSAALPLQAVGWRGSVSPVAVLWECSGGCDVLVSWNAVDLDDEIADCKVGWTLRKAYDVNDAGFIVGWGVRDSETHAFLLEPQDPCCPADLDGNGTVGGNDLLILLNSWGPCPNCGDCGVECVADLDCNCTVGASDQLILLDAWGPCDGGSSHDLDELEEAVEEMGYDDLEDYQAWLAEASEPEALASGFVLYTILQDQE